MAGDFLEPPLLEVLHVANDSAELMVDMVSQMGIRMAKNLIIVNIGATVPLVYMRICDSVILELCAASLRISSSCACRHHDSDEFFYCFDPIAKTLTDSDQLCALRNGGHRPSNRYSSVIFYIALGLTSLPWFLYYYTLKGYLVDRSGGLPPFWCHVYPFLSYILPTVWHTAGIFLTVFLAVQRYVYVCVPGSIHRVCTPKTTRTCVISIVMVRKT